MSWSRVAWSEKGQQYEDTIPSTWVLGNCIYWPRKNVKSAFEMMQEPGPDWMRITGAKVKLTGGKEECDYLGELGIPSESDTTKDQDLDEQDGENIVEERYKDPPTPPSALKSVFGTGSQTSINKNKLDATENKRKMNSIPSKRFSEQQPQSSTPVKFSKEIKVTSTNIGSTAPSKGSKLKSSKNQTISEDAGQDTDNLPLLELSGGTPASKQSVQAGSSKETSSKKKKLNADILENNKSNFKMPTDFPLSNERFQRKQFEMWFHINKKLDYIIEHHCKDEGSTPYSYTLPFIKTIDDVVSFESDIDDLQCFKAAMNELCQIGGADDKGMAANILKSLMADEVQREYSMEGRKGKAAFKELKMYNLIKKAILRKFRKSSEEDIRGFLMNHLKYAPKRLKNKEKKELGNAVVTTDSDSVSD